MRGRSLHARRSALTVVASPEDRGRTAPAQAQAQRGQSAVPLRASCWQACRRSCRSHGSNRVDMDVCMVTRVLFTRALREHTYTTAAGHLMHELTMGTWSLLLPRHSTTATRPRSRPHSTNAHSSTSTILLHDSTCHVRGTQWHPCILVRVHTSLPRMARCPTGLRGLELKEARCPFSCMHTVCGQSPSKVDLTLTN